MDSIGQAYVTGPTSSNNFPTTPTAFDQTINGFTDSFIAIISQDGSVLFYGTFLGGSNYDYGTGIAIDNTGQIYATGYTGSIDFPTKSGAFDTSFNGDKDAYLVTLRIDQLNNVVIFPHSHPIS